MSDNTLAQDAIVIERIFDAPVDVVWQLWTQPEHFKKWYGPKGFTIPVAEMDVRVGGKHLFCMASPDGRMKMWSTGEYLEIIPNERLVYTESMSDEQGNVLSMNNDFPSTTEVTVLLENLGGRTRMTLTHSGMPSNQPGAKEGASAGWQQAFDKLLGQLELVLKAR